jgi:hypothetical protein
MAPSWLRYSRDIRPAKVYGLIAIYLKHRLAFGHRFTLCLMWTHLNVLITQIAGLANIASNYLITGNEPKQSRHGTAHPSIVPYQVFPCRDGFLMIGAGNNKQAWRAVQLSEATVAHVWHIQFSLLAERVLKQPGLASDPRFATNGARVQNREALVRIISEVLMQHDRAHWLGEFTGLGWVAEFLSSSMLMENWLPDDTRQCSVWAHQLYQWGEIEAFGRLGYRL